MPCELDIKIQSIIFFAVHADTALAKPSLIYLLGYTSPHDSPHISDKDSLLHAMFITISNLESFLQSDETDRFLTTMMSEVRFSAEFPFQRNNSTGIFATIYETRSNYPTVS